MNRTNTATIIIGANVGGALSGFQRVQAGLGRLEQGISRIVSLPSLVTSLGLGLVAKQMIETSDRMSELSARVNLVGGSMEAVFQVAQQTRSSLDATATLYARMARAVEDYGYSLQQVLEITRLVNESMKISGASASEAEGAIIQFSQALAAGVLRGQEFNSMSEQAPLLMKALAKSLGVTIGELREMAREGKLTTDVVIEALHKQAGAIDAEFSKIPIKVSDAFTMLGNSMKMFVGDVSEATGAGHFFASMVAALSHFIDGFRQMILALGPSFREAWQYVKAFFASFVSVMNSVEQQLANFGDLLKAVFTFDWSGFDEALSNIKGEFKISWQEIGDIWKDASRRGEDIWTKYYADLEAKEKDRLKKALARQKKLLAAQKKTAAQAAARRALLEQERQARKTEAALKKLASIQERLFPESMAGKAERIRYHFQLLREEITRLAFEADIDLGRYIELMDAVDAKEQEALSKLKTNSKDAMEVHKGASSQVSEAWINAYNSITNALAEQLQKGGNLIKSFVSWAKQALAQLFAKEIVGSIAMGLGLPGATAWAGQGGGFGTAVSNGLGSVGSAISGAGSIFNWLSGGLNSAGLALMNFPLKAADFFGHVLGSKAIGSFFNTWSPGAMGGLTAGLGTFLMEGLLGGNWGKAAVSGASSGLGAFGGAALAPLIGATGPVGAIIGAIGGGLLGNIFGGGLFGDGTERTYLERAYRFKYDRDLGASYTYRTKRWDRGEPDWMDNLTQAEGKLADSFTETINNLVNSLSGITPELKDQISKIALETSTYWGVETEKEFKKRTEQNVVKMSQDLIGPIIELFKKDFSGQISGLDLSQFTDDFKETLSDGFTKALSQVDFSKIKTVDDLNKQLERLGKIVQGEKQLEAYVKKVKELDDQYKVATGILDRVHQQMLAVNDDWENQRQSLINMGVDLEKMPEFTEAWRKAIVSVSEELYGFAMALPDKINESWSKVSQEILKTDFGQNLVNLLNQALEGKIDLSTVGERWAGEVQETMRKSIMSEALSGLMDQVNGAYLAPLMQSFLGADFNLENIQGAFDQITQMGPDLAQAGQSIAEVFSYMQEHPDEGLKGFDWDAWQEQFGAVWEKINELNATRESQAKEQAQAIMSAAGDLSGSAKSLSASAQSLSASAGAISAAAARLQAPPPVYVTIEAAPTVVNGG